MARLAPGLGKQPRLAAQLSVNGGWERAVETALGDYLEALCVDELDDVADVLPTLPVGRVSLLQAGGHMEADGDTGMLSGVVSGPAAIVRLLSRVRLAETLSEALQLRRELADDESVITRSGEWIGRDWLRVNRGGDPHSGVLEREQRVKQLRVELARSEENTRDMETRLGHLPRRAGDGGTRARRRRRAASRARIANTPTCSVSSKVSAPVRRNPRCAASASKKRPRKSRAKSGSAQDALARARAELDRGLVALDALDSRRAALEDEREERREAVQAARAPLRRRRSSPAAIC